MSWSSGHGLVFDELTNGQALMHYDKHHRTASVTYTSLRACTRQPVTNGLVLLARWSVRQKLNCFSLVQFSYVALYKPKEWTPFLFLRFGRCVACVSCVKKYASSLRYVSCVVCKFGLSGNALISNNEDALYARPG